MTEVIDFANFEWDYEGLYYFLDCGFSAFGLTPVKDVVFLQADEELYTQNGITQIRNIRDIAEDIDSSQHKRTEDQILDLLRDKVRSWYDNTEGPIVLPLSGGFDSRLLASMLPDGERVKAFTYGISDDQSQSTEVVNAAFVAKTLGYGWEQIELGSFHRHIDDWLEIYGASTHCHGMYQMEFYHKILERHSLQGAHCLSGITADLWCGNARRRQIGGIADLKLIFFNHGLRASPDCLNRNVDQAAKQIYWNKYRDRLDDWRWQMILLCRAKMILLSYLLKIPKRLGFTPWTPFHDPEIVLALLNLPYYRKNERLWLREYYAKKGLDVESLGLNGVRQNSLNKQALKKMRPPQLSASILGEIISKEYVAEVNRKVCNLSWSRKAYNYIAERKFFPELKRRLKISDSQIHWYSAYLTLKPLEWLIKKREEALS